MRIWSRVRTLLLVAGACLQVPAIALAQDAESIKRELETMRHEFEEAKQQYERRLRELGDRLQTLEAQKAAPAPIPPPPAEPAAPPVTPSAPPPESPSLAELLRPRQPFALAQPGRILLFDIGVSGDVVASLNSSDQEHNQTGTFDGRENRVFLRHAEFVLTGRVDPYASAMFRFTAGEEAPEPGAGREAEIAVRLEEAYGTLLTLPLGTTLRFGVMHPRFGTLNMVHEEDLPQVDRPDVLRYFFGNEELNNEKGIEAFWLLPTPFYQELSLGLFNGDNEVAFGRGSLRDPLIMGRLRSFFELGETGGALQADISGATGLTDEGERNTVAGLGLKYKWSPLVGYAFPIVTLAGEGIYGDRTVRRPGEEIEEALAEDPGARVPATERFEKWGYYVYGQYDWSKRWATGLRWDWSELPTERGDGWAISPYLTFKPSEFLRLRLQYKHSEGSGPVLADEANEVFLQGTFIMGAHPTERF